MNHTDKQFVETVTKWRGNSSSIRLTELSPTVQNTLYSRFGNAPRFGDRSAFAELATSLGYPYFEWNERVYKVDYKGDDCYNDTGIIYQDLFGKG